MGIVFLVLFLGFPTYRYNHDGVGCARFLDEYAMAKGTIFYPTEPRENVALAPGRDVDDPENLGARQTQAGWWVIWNPHHLLYVPVTAVFFRMFRHLGADIGGMGFLQVWNSIASAITLLLLYRLCASVLKGSQYVLPWTLFLGFSATFFHYATDGAQYPTPVLFMTIAAGNIWLFSSDFQIRRLIRAGIWLALAVLFHQIVSLVVPIFSLAVYMRMRGARKDDFAGSKWSAWLPFVFGIGIPVIFYLIIGAFALAPTGEFNLRGIIKYATLYGQEKHFWATNPFYGFLTNLLTYIGFFFSNPRTFDAIFNNIPFTLYVMVLPSLWILTALHAKKISHEMRWWAGFNALWILPFLIFLSFWVPGNDFYHLFLSVPLTFLALIGAESARRSGREGIRDLVFFWAWCVAGIFINFSFSLNQSVRLIF